MNAPVKTPLTIDPRFLPNQLMIKGDGKPVVYLHGSFGQEWSAPLDALAERRRVIAPSNVGAFDLDELAHMDGLLDLLIYYDDVFNRLGLESFDLVGHGFGGMVAAEYAALFNSRIDRLVLIDALGLWRNDQPVADYNYVPADQVPLLMFHDLENPGVQELFASQPTEKNEIIGTALDRMTALGSTNHFLWPIPERGLHKRLGRIKAPTLILWGAQDRIVPPVYAQEFASRIADAKVVMIKGAGHAPQVEQPGAISAALADFLF
jgi:pimeloyl-ACP methyl ester carboxylesterase